MLVEHLRRLVEVHEHEAPAGSQDGGDASGPDFDVGETGRSYIGFGNGRSAAASRRMRKK